MAEEAIAETGSTHTDTSVSEASATVVPETIESEVITAPIETVEGAEGDGGNPVIEPGESTPVIPESYEFGEGADEALSSAMAPIFKEAGLTQEQVAKLSEAYGGVNSGKADIEQAAFTKQISDWEGELKSDPEFGGDNYAQNSGEVAAFFDATIPADIKDGLKSMFESTGLGSHPAFVKYFHALSRLMPVREDNPASVFKAPGGAKKSTEELMYPNG